MVTPAPALKLPQLRLHIVFVCDVKINISVAFTASLYCVSDRRSSPGWLVGGSTMSQAMPLVASDPAYTAKWGQQAPQRLCLTSTLARIVISTKRNRPCDAKQCQLLQTLCRLNDGNTLDRQVTHFRGASPDGWVADPRSCVWPKQSVQTTKVACYLCCARLEDQTSLQVTS
jgi:hypothetical protein